MGCTAVLVFDQRSTLAGRPGLHALLVGISDYPHLPGGGACQAADSYGMRQLSASAATAYGVDSWLTAPTTQVPVPLAAWRRVIPPSSRELPRLPDPSQRSPAHSPDPVP